MDHRAAASVNVVSVAAQTMGWDVGPGVSGSARGRRLSMRGC